MILLADLVRLSRRYELGNDPVDDVTGGHQLCRDSGQNVYTKQSGLTPIRPTDAVEQDGQLLHRLH